MRLLEVPVFTQGHVLVDDPYNKRKVRMDHYVTVDFQGDIPRLNIKFYQPQMIDGFVFHGLVARHPLQKSCIRCTYDHFHTIWDKQPQGGFKNWG